MFNSQFMVLKKWNSNSTREERLSDYLIQSKIKERPFHYNI